MRVSFDSNKSLEQIVTSNPYATEYFLEKGLPDRSWKAPLSDFIEMHDLSHEQFENEFTTHLEKITKPETDCETTFCLTAFFCDHSFFSRLKKYIGKFIE